MTSLPIDLTAVIVAGMSSIPGAAAAYFAYKSKKYAKVASHTGARNEGRLQDLSNGLMDEKIRRATKQVLDEHPALITEASVVQTLANILEKHLDSEKE